MTVPVSTLRRESAVAALLSFLPLIIAAHGRSTPYNNYALFAKALVNGRLWIDWPGPYIDAVLFEGRRYIVNDPLPGVLMIPQVLVGFYNQTWLAIVLCAIAVAAAWWLCRQSGLDPQRSAWLTAFLFAGTDLWWCSMLGDVWFLAQTSLMCFGLVMLVELTGRRRGWLVALWFACAVLSRFTFVLAAPVVIAAFIVLADGNDLRARCTAALPRLRAFIATALPFAVLYVAYNVARWHTPFDEGHTIFYHQDTAAGRATGSPFGLDHVPYQLWSFFVQSVDFAPAWPYVVPGMSGQALTWTSPALALAFLARRPRALVATWWTGTALVAIPALTYFVNGFAQFGMRHALDFEPFLFALMVLAARETFDWVWRALCVWSIAVGAWGVWYWDTFVRNVN